MMCPVALTIAGSDCSAGAGLQADLKTFSSFGVHGLTAVTCVVSETPLQVNEIHPVPPAVLKDQILLLLTTYPIAAIKTGMLYSGPHIMATCEALADSKIPLVVDPVMVASTGDPLLSEEALAVIRERLLPMADVITPNLPEAAELLGRPVRNLDEQKNAALELSDQFGAACYLKGGHASGNGKHVDILARGEEVISIEGEHLDIPQTHGTGCTLSAAFAAALACQKPLEEAAQEAHRFTHRALRQSIKWTVPGSEDQVFHLNQNQST